MRCPISAVRCLARLVVPLLAASSANAQSAGTVPQRNLGTHPPHVLSVTARLLSTPVAAGNAVVEVKVAQSEALPSQLAIYLEAQSVSLRDDGSGADAKARDNVYSAIVNLDVASIKANQERLRKLQGRHGKLVMPVYRGRELVSRVPLPDEFFAPALPGAKIPIDRWGFAEGVVAERSLLIRDPRVVEDPARTYDPCSRVGTPMGKWTFGFLMQELADPAHTKIDPADFVRRWIDESRTAQSVGGWTVGPFNATGDTVLNAWPTLPDGRLDLARAPFKLLAIVNRVDLRDNVVYGSSNVGEARMVFGFRPCDRPDPPLTVIFEYGIERVDCPRLKGWARQWLALSDTTPGSKEFNSALEAITDQFSIAGAAPSRRNRSALNQLRTNGGTADLAWEFREFRLRGPRSGVSHLSMVTVQQTPSSAVALSPAYLTADVLGHYVNTNAASIIADDYSVPLYLGELPFRGGAATAGVAVGGWNSSAITQRQARHKFSLNTCNGCHLLETASGFYHVRPPSLSTPFGVAASLSDFMTGVTVPDPYDGAPTRHFNELERRAVDLDGLANGLCIAALDPTERFDRAAIRGPIPLRMGH